MGMPKTRGWPKRCDIGITNRERKRPLKVDAVPSILSYVPEKKVRQAINAGTPVAVAKT